MLDPFLLHGADAAEDGFSDILRMAVDVLSWIVLRLQLLRTLYTQVIIIEKMIISV